MLETIATVVSAAEFTGRSLAPMIWRTGENVPHPALLMLIFAAPPIVIGLMLRPYRHYLETESAAD